MVLASVCVCTHANTNAHIMQTNTHTRMHVLYVCIVDANVIGACLNKATFMYVAKHVSSWTSAAEQT